MKLTLNGRMYLGKNIDRVENLVRSFESGVEPGAGEYFSSPSEVDPIGYFGEIDFDRSLCTSHTFYCRQRNCRWM